MEGVKPKLMVWGRESKPDLLTQLGSLLILLLSPWLVLFFYNCMTYNGGSIIIDPYATWNYYNLPHFQIQTLYICLLWIMVQIILALLPDQLHKFIPYYHGDLQTGQFTPGGNLVYYQINGLQAWVLTLMGYIMACYFNWIEWTWIADSWGSILISANLIGYSLATLAWIKANICPTYINDNKWSGSFHYDYLMGIEHNPQIWGFDIKLFMNGRPGIIAWTLINLSFTAKQYQQYGMVCDSLILVNLLQGIYVVDFFWNEKWYLKTIDIAHDHFGWYLAWGDCVWLPFMYTLQAQYLANNAIILGSVNSYLILGLGLIGYIIFRWANHQRDHFRAYPERNVWFAEPKTLICKYYTMDQKEHTSLLLYSGLWGWSRHMNYTGDILLSLAYCLACGGNHILPYFYAVYMVILLIHRCYRDEHRCRIKYGKYWEEYCKLVPYRFIPYIY